MVSNLMNTDRHALSREFFKAMVCLSIKPINQQHLPFVTVTAPKNKTKTKQKKNSYDTASVSG